jgi:hypothetical protein
MSQAARYFAPIDFKRRFPALDGIRAVAVTLVFLDHFGGGAHDLTHPDPERRTVNDTFRPPTPSRGCQHQLRPTMA